MKHCDKCNQDFDTEGQTCLVCGEKLHDMAPEETEIAEIVSTMTLTGIL